MFSPSCQSFMVTVSSQLLLLSGLSSSPDLVNSVKILVSNVVKISLSTRYFVVQTVATVNISEKPYTFTCMYCIPITCHAGLNTFH